ncbi:TetR family transcriptional regulator [Pseudonocardia acaciae]|uniref:TetR family transcriptional regulator n=1 Tax=Pseudonocardia acaciae TaxID=551276 RepID=UPI0006868909|nr:TetR family transcriptional regulator [Pseudonocardia acaciae]
MSLRERKKRRTRAELQRHALRLFRDRGYAETTVDDIAAAAEVSRSTFFRYFGTKEDVLLFDNVEPAMRRMMAEVPEGTPLLQALRGVLRDSFASLDDEARDIEEVRMELALTVPAIAAILRERDAWGIEQYTGMIAAATDREPDDPDVLLFSAIVLGARHAARARLDAGRAERYLDELDAMLGRLDAGVPLANEPVRAPARITRLRAGSSASPAPGSGA